MNNREIKQGLDGFFYMIFSWTDDAWEYAERYNLQIACFDGYENAVRLHDTIGY